MCQPSLLCLGELSINTESKFARISMKCHVAMIGIWTCINYVQRLMWCSYYMLTLHYILWFIWARLVSLQHPRCNRPISQNQPIAVILEEFSLATILNACWKWIRFYFTNSEPICFIINGLSNILPIIPEHTPMQLPIDHWIQNKK